MKIEKKIEKYLVKEFTDPDLRDLVSKAEREAKEEAKKLAQSFKHRVDDTLESMDWFAKEVIKTHPDDPKEQAKSFNVYVAQLIGFQENSFAVSDWSFSMLDELISEIDEHAKTIRKKYGWYRGK